MSTSKLVRHLDTDICINLRGQWIYLFTSEMSECKLVSLKNNVKRAYNSQIAIWVYKISQGKVSNFLDDNLPFKTILHAARAIKNISPHTIKKYLDTNLPFKERYFFSKPKSLNQVQNILNKSANLREGIWVYKNLNSQICLLYSQPFTSNYQAGIALNIGEMTINKYLDTYITFKVIFLQ